MRVCQGSISGLGVPLDGCERIQGTPLPFVYVAHLRSFLLFCMPSRASNCRLADPHQTPNLAYDPLQIPTLRLHARGCSRVRA